MLVNFVKMQALGNDFVIVDLITQNLRLYSAHFKKIADRHLGIGCDQILVIEPPIHSDADFFYRIYNADGQEVEQCGNGARCVARFFYESGYVTQPKLRADCPGGRVEFEIHSKDWVKMNLGKPQFKPALIPFNMPNQAPSYTLEVEGKLIEFSVVSLGNPHLVITVPNVETAPVSTVGASLVNHPLFPKGVNVSFMEILDPSHIRLRVYERGVGETLSCGSAACAAAVIGIQRQLLKDPVLVSFARGDLEISWSGEGSPVYMKGPAQTVYTGRFRC